MLARRTLSSVKVTDSLTITNVAFSDSSLLTAPTLLSVVSGGTVTANSLSLLSLSSVNISYISVPTCKYTGSLSTHLLSIQLNAATTAQVNVGSITFNVLSAQTRSRPTSISPSQERRVCRFNLSYDNSPFRHILIVTALFTVPANNLIVTQATISSPLLESDTMITPFAIVSGGTAKQTNVVLDGGVLAARFAHSMLIQTGGSLSLNSCTFNSITTSDEGQRSKLISSRLIRTDDSQASTLPTTKAATHTHTNGAFDIPSGTPHTPSSICLFVENTADCGGAVEDFSISVVDSSSFTDPHYVLDNFKLDDEFIVTIVDKVPVTNQTEINSKTLTICGNRFDSELSTNNAFSVGFEVKFRSTESVHLVETKASAKTPQQDAGVRQVDTSATVTITPAQSESHFYNSQTKNVQTVLSEDQTEYVAYVTGSQLIPCETATAVLFETTDVPSDVAFHNNTLIIVQISNDDIHGFGEVRMGILDGILIVAPLFDLGGLPTSTVPPLDPSDPASSTDITEPTDPTSPEDPTDPDDPSSPTDPSAAAKKQKAAMIGLSVGIGVVALACILLFLIIIIYVFRRKDKKEEEEEEEQQEEGPNSSEMADTEEPFKVAEDEGCKESPSMFAGDYISLPGQVDVTLTEPPQTIVELKEDEAPTLNSAIVQEPELEQPAETQAEELSRPHKEIKKKKKKLEEVENGDGSETPLLDSVPPSSIQPLFLHSNQPSKQRKMTQMWSPSTFMPDIGVLKWKCERNRKADCVG
ncbi:hypothetical protein BLNAU_25162 [Blattamonas nauphoetae]|uniref:Uncharacterized protein n=1 Tax=Blattamonas nauphoetae TaxID=2049346 RepID=A0ABQ9WKR2_9EUKA|nr:hypothetical protein BLNAU_25162 [Blattamonas nauphoetae]